MLILGTVPLIAGCVPPANDAATATVPFAKQADLDALKVTVNSKADSSRLDSLIVRIDGLAGNTGNSGTANTYSKADLYTRVEVDAAIAKAITDLKTAAPWGQATVNPGGSGSPTGSVTFATNPVSIPQVYSGTTGSGQSTFYTFKIINGTSAWQYVKPIVTLTVAPSYSSRSITGITATMSGNSCSMAGSRLPADPASSTVGQFSISPSVGSGAPATTSLVIIPIAGCNGNGEFQVGAGQSVDVLVQITGLTSSDVTLWNISNSISSRQM